MVKKRLLCWVWNTWDMGNNFWNGLKQDLEPMKKPAIVQGQWKNKLLSFIESDDSYRIMPPLNTCFPGV